MEYVKKFTEYCVSVINSKKVEIPDKKLSQSVRQQEFIVSYKVMTMYLKDAFYKEGKMIEEQAHRENKTFTLEELKEMQQIGDTKIKEFIKKAENEFLGIDME